MEIRTIHMIQRSSLSYNFLIFALIYKEILELRILEEP